MLNNLFPNVRPRRLRKNKIIRDLVSETRLSKSKLIQPLFVSESVAEKQPLESLQGQFLFSRNAVFEEIDELLNLGIKTIALFPNISESLKDEVGTNALDEKNFVCK
jgi:Delta-aminolevulinic acid dehydratase